MNPQEIIDIPYRKSLSQIREYETKKWTEIVVSISAVELKRPITVSRRRSQQQMESFDLVCGQGRIEAFLELGETTIPSIVTEMSREEQFLGGLVENLARRPPSNCGIFRELRFCGPWV